MNIQQSNKLTLLGTVSGLTLPEEINELLLDKTRIFRNPAATRMPGGLPELGANTAIYSGEGTERHLAGEVATYLIESKFDSPDGRIGHTRVGSGSVMIGTSDYSRGVTLNTGKKPNSAVSIAVPLGKTWNSPILIQSLFDRAVLPLRLLTKARILVFPVGALVDEPMQEILDVGLSKSCSEPFGTGLEVELSSGDCKEIEAFSHKLAKVNLDEFEVPLFLFSRSFYKADVADKALDLIIAMESLLSGSSESISYKIAFRASCLTAKTEDERWSVFQFAKESYGYRNTLVHGNKKTLAKARDALAHSIGKVEELTRLCLKLACILEVERLRLPSGLTVNMRKEETIDEYILTLCLNERRETPLDSLPEVGRIRQFTRVL